MGERAAMSSLPLAVGLDTGTEMLVELVSGWFAAEPSAELVHRALPLLSHAPETGKQPLAYGEVQKRVEGDVADEPPRAQARRPPQPVCQARECGNAHEAQSGFV